ncbi:MULTISPECIES: EI24 domain-containing protein [Campylobacter]|uniref:EI24 domain-containing protein n=1 Tax=Campylobacter porcelli TaxID=1660073 RepID=A0ABU7M4Z1_9BACT|nr:MULTISPECIES: EI24 domain-containing protein [unclassified Campylobacter]MCR8696701.1 EI24 domain-containing protein [Campylobacter sp. RM19073]MEE3744777.1 EI24 domain-containing protein [Campylobacter sp. CX2-4855-23]
MNSVIKRSFADFLSLRFILLSILPLAVSLASLIGLVVLFGDDIFAAFAKPQIQTYASGDGFIAWLISLSLVQFIITSSFYVISIFLAIILSVAIAAVITGFLTPYIVKFINQKYYNYNTTPDPSNIRVLNLIFITFIKFILIFLICIPLLFIPVINLFILNLPFFYLFYRLMLIDVASNTSDRLIFEVDLQKGGGVKFFSASVIFYIITLIPFVGLFSQIFFVIFLSHLLLEKNSKGF